jgi:hypothetical protein
MSTEPEVLDLELPQWLPSVVKLAAAKIDQHRLSEGTPDDIRLLNRLTSDERMKKVWREIGSRSARIGSAQRFQHPTLFYNACLAREKRKKASELRSKGGYFDMATAKVLESEADVLAQASTEAHNAWSAEECAVYCFFYGAYDKALGPGPLPTRKSLDDLHKEYSDVTKKLRALAERLRAMGMDHHAEELVRIALEVEENKLYIETNYEDRGTRIVERQRSDPLLQSYVVQLATITRVIFGSPLYGTIATTATVALDLKEPATGPEIREIIDRFPFTGLGLYDIIPWD